MPSKRSSRRHVCRRLGAATAILAAGALALTACGGSDDAKDDAKGTTSITIFAAASLQGPLDDVAKDFEKSNSDFTVKPITYDGSQALATQAIDGADVDVLAFASEASLEPVTEAGLTDKGQIFATNTLELAVAPGNPKGLATWDDLTEKGVSVVVCAAEVPCGQATEKLTADAGVTLKPVSQETNVTSVVNRVAGGEADAGLVYATDVTAAGDKLEGVELPNADKAVNRYPVAVSADAENSEGGKAFVDYLLSDAGQKTLHDAGFGKP
ncbi:MAG: molybdate ABC transporter substrate-binding protein [Galactobacter sp.]|uniref:molybdate ABC transporter substrate-binding protein n=1 Tax=Galactobacter sp. TaxID=2676125 RepID=UPI0025BA1E31|nr:molybdate ABC transporter substrate-binding protein [Galactobacter sp.]